jgi:hypothetical protein
MTPEDLASLPPHIRVVLAAGVIRSGSTPLFNVARLLLREAGESFTAGWINDLAPPMKNTVLVKIHEWHASVAERANIVLTCHRDLREVARSLAAIGWLKTGSEAFEQIRGIVYNHTQWKLAASVDIPYEYMIVDWKGVVAKIASVLVINVSRTDVEAIAREVCKLSAPAALVDGRQYDPTTLMHRNHRSGKKICYSQIENEVHQQFLRWQTVHGYK